MQKCLVLDVSPKAYEEEQMSLNAVQKVGTGTEITPTRSTNRMTENFYSEQVFKLILQASKASQGEMEFNRYSK